MLRPFLAPFTAVCLLCLVGCTGRDQADPFATHATTDFATAPDATYVAAAEALSVALGRELSALPGARGYGPRDILALSDGGHLLVAVEPWSEAELVLLARTDARGGVRWQHELPLAAGSVVDGARLVDQDGVRLVRLTLSEAGGVTALYLALSGDGPIVVRAEAQGALGNARFRQAHPRVPVSPGKLGSDDRIDQLAATVHLAGPGRAGDRGKPVVRGHLEALAGSTDRWLAQAAADLLTMPSQ